MLACLSPHLHAAAVAVGDSSLIGQLDYSDTFSIGAGNPGERYGISYGVGGYPLPEDLLPVENSYGNPARAWSPARWSLNNDAVFLSGSLIFPGGSGAGSISGFTQTGGGVDFGIEYGLRSNFVAQFDAVQTIDRVDITISGARDGLAGANGLSVFFRADGFQSPSGTSAEVGIYNPSIGEVLTTLDTGLAGLTVGEWNNYAVHFDLDSLQLGIYANEVFLGAVDLTTFGGPLWPADGAVVAPGAFAGVIDATTNGAVSVGAFGGDRVWTDNFQIGAVIPEPSTGSLALLAVFGLLRRRLR